MASNSGGQFQVVQVFAAEIFGELGVERFARDLNHAYHYGIRSMIGTDISF